MVMTKTRRKKERNTIDIPLSKSEKWKRMYFLSLAIVLYFVRTVTVCSRRLRERKQDCKAKKTTQKSLFSLFNRAQHTD
jgi:uncharacterized protein YpmS